MDIKQAMKSFLSKLSPRKWQFAISIYAVGYVAAMIGTYQLEVERISKISFENLGGNITPNLSFFDVLKSADWHYLPRWGLLAVGGTYLLIAVYFFDFKNEMHSGWRRVYISAQIIIPTLMALFLVFTTNYDSNFWEIGIFLVGFGWTEVVVLILIKFHIWIKEGFAKQAD